MKDFVSSPGQRVFAAIAPFSLAWVASSILNPDGPGLIGLAGACLTLPAALWLRRGWATPLAAAIPVQVL
jgi:hypothetical protein